MNSRSAITGGVDSYGKKPENQPSPSDFENFLPWACGQLEIPVALVINKIKISDAARGNATLVKGNKEDASNTDTESVCDLNDIIGRSSINNIAYIFYIDAVYDNSNDLVQLKFNRNLTIPVAFLKLLTLIVQFQPHLTAICITQGINASGLYQLNKIVNLSNITDVILDNTFVTEANYYILLDDNSPLKYLSLARCLLNDTAVKRLASRLRYPSKASKTLTVLNLSSNRITDEGAKYLGDILRTNRQLAYLNLAGNMISDTGADSILSSLMTFPLTTDEMNEKKLRKFSYIKKKNKFINETVECMRIDYEKKYAAKKKLSRASPNVTKRTKSIEASQDIDVSLSAVNAIWLEKAEAVAAQMAAPFQDPFSFENVTVRNGVIYSYGNNSLCYLNLAYNNLSYYSVKKLHSVISTQHDWSIKPKGLINVCIEGNEIPTSCEELSEINVFIEIKLARMQSNSALIKKKTGRTK